jgi:hypothetical protein
MIRQALRALVTCLGCAVILQISTTDRLAAQPAASNTVPAGEWLGGSCERSAYDDCDSDGPTVKVTVSARALSGQPLHYRWRSTDGRVVNRDASNTIWKLPSGPGLHFIYVLVSDRMGGYTERRLAINTDQFGGRTRPTERHSGRYLAPPAPAVTTGTFRGFMLDAEFLFSERSFGGLTQPVPHDVNVPDVPFTVYGTSSTYRSEPVLSNVRGEFVVPGIPQSQFQSLGAEYDGLQQDFYSHLGGPGAFGPDQPPASAASNYTADYFLNGGIGGSLALADGSFCGTVNEFFGIEVTGTAERLDGGKITAGPARTNNVGAYALPDPTGTGNGTALLRCEHARAQKVINQQLPDGGSYFPAVVFPLTGAPIVNTMTAVLEHGGAVGNFAPPPTGLPSDSIPMTDFFLARKGIDDRQSACQYYQAIGAVRGCDRRGNFIGAITFEQWKRATHMAPYTLNGRRELEAVYVNRIDLNLTRHHHAISYGPTNTAAYVCNHQGPPFDSQEGDAAVDTAIANAAGGLNEIACVAMDYMVTAAVNGGKPFVRVLIFAPGGQLLPSINLDGRGEKFVPGSCVACHGGNNYAGSFAASQSGHSLPDIGSHFLPFDTGNFLFSTQVGLREADQEAAIKALNLLILNSTGATQAEKDLVHGWYAPNLTAGALDKNYVPPAWDSQDNGDPNGLNHQSYRKIVARMCRTCHVATPDTYNFDVHDFQADVSVDELENTARVCGEGNQLHVDRSYSMPNSLVTFNRFWTTQGTSDDLPALWASFLAQSNGSVSCDLGHE